VKRNRPAIEEVREMWRRSGGTTPRLGFKELAAIYEEMLAGVSSIEQFRAADLRLSADRFVPSDERERLWALPSVANVRGRDVEIDYDIEERDGASQPVARLRLPEKIGRTLTTAELPALDRPLRFVVLRGQRGAVRADTIEELQEALDRPWSPDEVDDRETRTVAERASPDEQRVREIASEFRRERDRGRGGGRRFRGGRGDRGGEADQRPERGAQPGRRRGGGRRRPR
jgi:hypothetical protein